MGAISPDIAKKLLHRDLANLAHRVQRGGNLSRSERVMLQSMAVSTGQVPAVAAWENGVSVQILDKRLRCVRSRLGRPSRIEVPFD